MSIKICVPVDILISSGIIGRYLFFLGDSYSMPVVVARGRYGLSAGHFAGERTLPPFLNSNSVAKQLQNPLAKMILDISTF